MKRTQSSTIPVGASDSIPFSALPKPPDTWHLQPKLVQNPDGAVKEQPSVSELSCRPGVKARQLCEAEWTKLKPLLRKLYIEENKTLDAVRKTLQEIHGLKLSKKQLTKRFADWNFKKNVKQHETGAFLSKTQPLPGEPAASMDGVRITAAKRERWEKRLKTLDNEQKSTYTEDLEGIFDPPSNFTDQTPLAGIASTNLSSTSRYDDTSDVLIMSSSTLSAEQTQSLTHHVEARDRVPLSLAVSSVKATSSGFSPRTLSIDSFERVETSPGGHVDLCTVQEPEHDFTPPTPLNTPDRDTELTTRLLSLLKIDPAGITLCSPPTPTVPEVPASTTNTVSLQDLEAYSSDGRLVPWVGKQALLYGSVSLGSIEAISQQDEETSQQGTIMLASHRYGSRKRTTTGALKFPSVDVIFSSSRVVELDPFSLEVYPFPQNQRRRLKVQPVVTYYKVIGKYLNDCLLKVNQLESTALGSTTTSLKMKKKLADIYFELGHFEQAEYEYRQIILPIERQYGKHSQQFICVKTYLADATLALGKVQEANQIAQDVHDLARRFDPGGVSYQRATAVLARSFGCLEDQTSEEKLLRELIQIRMTTFGPRHAATISAISNFCHSIFPVKRDSESEELLRLALELSFNVTDVSDLEQCFIRYSLGRSLYYQGKYADSEVLLRKTVSMSERLLGMEHRDTLSCKLMLCNILRARGLFSESHDILLEMLEVCIENLEEILRNTIGAVANMSARLMLARKMDDAHKWILQTCLHWIEIYEIESGRGEQFSKYLSSIDQREEIPGLCNKMTQIYLADAVWFGRTLPTLSWQESLPLLESQRKSDSLSASPLETERLHDDTVVCLSDLVSSP